ncbi:unnamed protein product [Arctogadus glacialis]
MCVMYRLLHLAMLVIPLRQVKSRLYETHTCVCVQHLRVKRCGYKPLEEEEEEEEEEDVEEDVEEDEDMKQDKEK